MLRLVPRLISLFFALAAMMIVPSIAMAAVSGAGTSEAKAPSAFSNANLKGLSMFGSFDMTDNVDVSSGGNTSSLNMDKTFGLGAEYSAAQFGNGLSVQGGGTYEFGRDIKPQNGQAITLSTWTAFGELAMLLTPQFQVMGGVNYNFPSLSNANGTPKGRIGYQFGGSFLASNHFAVDARYRVLNMIVDANNGTSSDAKIQGLVIDGRYMF